MPSPLAAPIRRRAQKPVAAEVTVCGAKQVQFCLLQGAYNLEVGQLIRSTNLTQKNNLDAGGPSRDQGE